MSAPVNWLQQMQSALQTIPAGTRPRLLLHACCGPCSSAVLEQLRRIFDITVFYYNPNTWPEAEYRRRGEELAKLLRQLPGEGTVDLAEDPYRPEEFYQAVAGLENEPERGGRCTVCYRLRLSRAAAYASAHGYDWFCSTLSISPHKDAARLNAIGLELEKEYGVRWLPSDFKKKEGYKRSLELSREYGLYRQAYCGCEFSAKARGIDPENAALPPEGK